MDCISYKQIDQITTEGILQLMVRARSGHLGSWDLFFQIAAQKKFKKQVEACRRLLCEKNRLRPTTSLLNLLGHRPATKVKSKEPHVNTQKPTPGNGVPSHRADYIGTASYRKTTGTQQPIMRCSQCDGFAILGDDRCFRHIK